MSSAFSTAKFTTQPFCLNTTSPRSPDKPLFDPLKIPNVTSPFLGSTRKLRLSSSSKWNLHRRSGTIVAISDVVKEKKSKSTPNLLITKEEGLELYEDMVLGRSFEDMCAQMYYREKRFCRKHIRDHVHALSKGVPARAVMSELFGIPVATGAAFTYKREVLKEADCDHGFLLPLGAFTYKREVLKEADCDHVTLAFFGGGTCNNGQFFECLNMAALCKLPIVFVVENNLWAFGMSHLRATSDPQIYKKGPAFGMPGIHVDGMDVLKVREVAKEAIARARRGEGPTLVECETYRFRGHLLADPDELRDPAEKAHYAARDPITALKKYLFENSLASEAELKAIDKKIDEVVEDAVEFADESPLPARSQLLENVFADPKGFGIGPDGQYRCEDPKFTEGTAHV
ncbi:hypothetical protein CRYUN_Cryun20dG0041100 [Craigia yunnanensis]